MIIHWYRKADYDNPGKQVNPSLKQTKPVKPKSISPKKLKNPFHGPKLPQAWKKKLYIPKRFIHAQEGDDASAVLPMDFQQMKEFLPAQPYTSSTDVADETDDTDEFEDDYNIVTEDIVSSAIRAREVGGVRATLIEFMPSPNPCGHCGSLVNHKWLSVAAFEAAKSEISKTDDLKYLVHPGCQCKVKVTMSDGSVFEVGSMGA